MRDRRFDKSGAAHTRHTRKKGLGRMPQTKAPGRTGLKMQRAANKGRLGMDHPGGVVSEALREMVRDKRVADRVDRDFCHGCSPDKCMGDCDK